MDDTERRPYVYEPFAAGGEYIRLIVLQPALKTDAPLHITFLHNQDLEHDTVQYEAISYTWGEPKFDHLLHVDDGSQLKLTANLATALRRVRKLAEPRILWVDALCINQSDLEEKSRQIPMMASIFHNASRVLACLGGGKTEEKGMRLLDSWSRSLGSSFDLRLRRQGTDAVGTMEDPKVLNPTSMLTIFMFLYLPWFSRLWIIQEVVFNVDVLLICGASQMSWVRLVTALEALHESPRAYNSQFTASHPNLINVKELASLRVIANLWKRHCMVDIKTDVGKIGIVQLVENFRHHGCVDVRDRIYALYNMADDILPMGIAGISHSGLSYPINYVYMDVNYGADFIDVYRLFAASCLCSSSRANLINALIARKHVPAPEGWPSWVPDWRVEPMTGLKEFVFAFLPTQGDKTVYVPGSNTISVELPVQQVWGFSQLFVVQSSYPVRKDLDGFIRFVVEFCKMLADTRMLLGLLREVFPDTNRVHRSRLLDIIDRTVASHITTNRLGVETFTTAPEMLEGITLVHERLLGHSVFTVRDSSRATHLVLGFGTTSIQAGDELVPLKKPRSGFRSGFSPSWPSLVLRPVGSDLVPPLLRLHSVVGGAHYIVSVRGHAFALPMIPTWNFVNRVFHLV